MGHLEQKQFVGSMAFNRFIQASPSPVSASTAPQSPSEAPLAAAATPDSPGTNAGTSGISNGSMSPSPSPSRTITITSENNSADGDSGETRALSSSSSLGRKGNGRDEVSDDWLSEEEDEEDDVVDDEGMYIEDNRYIPGGGGVFEEAKEVALNVLRRDSIVGNIAMAQSFVLDAEGHRRHGVGEMERSGTTVTATTEVMMA